MGMGRNRSQANRTHDAKATLVHEITVCSFRSGIVSTNFSGNWASRRWLFQDKCPQGISWAILPWYCQKPLLINWIRMYVVDAIQSTALRRMIVTLNGFSIWHRPRPSSIMVRAGSPITKAHNWQCWIFWRLNSRIMHIGGKVWTFDAWKWEKYFYIFHIYVIGISSYLQIFSANLSIHEIPHCHPIAIVPFGGPPVARLAWPRVRTCRGCARTSLWPRQGVTRSHRWPRIFSAENTICLVKRHQKKQRNKRREKTTNNHR